MNNLKAIAQGYLEMCLASYTLSVQAGSAFKHLVQHPPLSKGKYILMFKLEIQDLKLVLNCQSVTATRQEHVLGGIA